MRRKPLGSTIRWPKRLIALLGEVPDRVIADALGCGLSVVAEERQKRRIPSYATQHPRCEWTPEKDALLGKDSDRAVAAVLGVSQGAVATRRRSLGIPARWPPKEKVYRKWSKREIALLGTRPDTEIAEKIGVGLKLVYEMRKRLGIASPYSSQGRPELPAAALKLLGKIADTEISRRFGVGVRRVRRKRRELGIPPIRTSQAVILTPELRAVLKQPVHKTSHRADISHSTLLKLRRRLGIKGKKPGVECWTPKVVAQIGKKSDTQLARELGIHEDTVRRKR
ncbi:MAG: hypothetical protein HC897_12260 [Thermoanaerobaculia bacterium]|nr:hypothetical protein [Thermoanaerobaculia bacterium]